jgi:hypothetical protein
MRPISYPYGGYGGYGHHGHGFPGFGHHGFGHHGFGHHGFGHHGFGRRLFPFFSLFPFGFFGYRNDEQRAHLLYAEHTVEAGDTMWKIAQKYNMPLPILIAFNPQIANPNVITLGEKVYLPRLCDMYCQKMYVEQDEDTPMSMDGGGMS